ncbi:transporter, UIT6 family [Andreprevotia lacus DSM 23236]|jgi:Na+/H+ antiporter NhaD/arsenite permease-like protein|uniref:Transporter, UIT6 family n=1 Tax=Andreprevotia lacus DSM 23236 TaxID=1121001 RepID=A0A1W1Y0K2_9NEIS|nr:sodium:proton antiporter [Andreprevotia lacus]SMC29739.1 transporter, UIT6 family [Andreprevotia lacus DSM 23236]
MRKTPLHLFPLLMLPGLAQAADFDGAHLSLLWTLPFAGILLSIAVFPLLAPHLWHAHFGKIAAFWAGLLLIPLAINFGPLLATQVVVHALLAEYIPFILLLFALYTVSGGILVWGNLHGSAKLNTGILALGTLLASVMGTTGAAMLLIRPLLRANDNRRHNVHVVVFFIFLVANIGGGLTPLGDPPLFLGFLKGVDFFWTTSHMLPSVLFCTAVLLTVFYLLDSHYFRKEGVLPRDPSKDSPLKLYGKRNFWLIAAIVGAVLMSGLWKSGIEFDVLGTHVTLENLLRDVLLLCIGLISLRITPKQVRAGNEFNWDPILEVAKLFAGIFITITPAIAILRAGEAGHLAALVKLVSNSHGEPVDVMYFWMTGILSSFLDNAPTYLVFFNMASGDAAHLMGPMASTLLAISMGAVFMGANTYIGNAPNFMVKAIAEQRNVAMPSFFGFMLWSGAVLMPLFLLTSWLFF